MSLHGKLNSYINEKIFVRLVYQVVNCINATLRQQGTEVKWQWFPSGTYKSMYKASDDKDDNIFTLVTRNEVVNNFQDNEF
jgi:hypothetical protein